MMIPIQDVPDWETIAAVARALELAPRPVLDEWRGNQWSVLSLTAPWYATVGWTSTQIRYRRGEVEFDVHVWGPPTDVAAEVRRTLVAARSAL
jgi:hypothetical protein